VFFCILCDTNIHSSFELLLLLVFGAVAHQYYEHLYMRMHIDKRSHNFTFIYKTFCALVNETHYCLCMHVISYSCVINGCLINSSFIHKNESCLDG